MGFVLIGVYTIGYIIPFLLVGVFTTSLLEFFGKHRNVVKYTVKIGGVILVIMGLLMITGKMNGISSYLSKISGQSSAVSVEETEETENEAADEADTVDAVDDDDADTADVAEADDASETADDTEVEGEVSEASNEEASDDTEDEEVFPAPDFALTDQYGNTHSIADYRGKIIFLNFWATWCPPCRAELPYIQELYTEYSANPDADTVFLTVAFPNSSGEEDIDGIKSFLDENGYTFPVLMDEAAELQAPYYITAFPTTYIISPEGNVLGYVPGGMRKDIMKDVLDQAREMIK